MDDGGPRRIAFQGERGAYGEEATRAFFGPSAVLVPCPSFRAVFEAVAEGRVDGGVVPMESALAGPVAEKVDLVLEFTPRLTGELRLRVPLFSGHQGQRICVYLRPGGNRSRESAGHQR